MPRGDGTGPMGTGLLTGWGAGRCAGYAAPGFADPARGRGTGMRLGGGRGFGGRGGRGWRNMFRATGQPGWMRFSEPAEPVQNPEPAQEPMPRSAPQTEQPALERQIEALQSELELIKKRLAEADAVKE